MVAGNESLDCEDLVGGERAEDVRDSQCLRVAVGDHIGPRNSAKCYQRPLFISITIDIGAEQEPARGASVIVHRSYSTSAMEGIKKVVEQMTGWSRPDAAQLLTLVREREATEREKDVLRREREALGREQEALTHQREAAVIERQIGEMSVVGVLLNKNYFAGAD